MSPLKSARSIKSLLLDISCRIGAPKAGSLGVQKLRADSPWMTTEDPRIFLSGWDKVEEWRASNHDDTAGPVLNNVMLKRHASGSDGMLTDFRFPLNYGGMPNTSALCYSCGKENLVNLGTSHKDGKDPDVYRIVCKSCGRINNVGVEDMSLRRKSRTEVDAHAPVSAFSWV